MKKLIFIIVFLLFGCAAINIKGNRNDDKNIIIKTETLFNNGIIVESREYYMNGNEKEESTFRNGQISLVKEYYEDGKLKNKINVKDRTYIEYNENGSKKEEGTLDNVTLGFLSMSSLANLGALTVLVEMPEGNGINKEYYEDGTIKEEVSYSNGKLNGIFKEYYEDGSLKSEGNYHNGVMDGIIKEYYPSSNNYK
ncbi:MAG: hypothetical protein QF380_07445 [Candidatus Marinimicrobia bacterium]|jgi:antitoxin component YwqK of YwqJK toxin-antitoxin module|nr:hypothetical protein [Candidatus Neomarinimicrobiota bacterium]